MLWLHCECGGCCHHFDVGLQGTSCPLAEGHCELTRIMLWLYCECDGCCHDLCEVARYKKSNFYGVSLEVVNF